MLKHFVNILIGLLFTYAVGVTTYLLTENDVENINDDTNAFIGTSDDTDTGKKEVSIEKDTPPAPKFEIVEANGVFLVDTKTSKKYHSRPNCQYLRKSPAPVIQVSLESAQNAGRTPCKKCFKK